MPLVALFELGAHLWISGRASSPAEWAAVAAPIHKLAAPGSVLVVAPGWAEPLARHVLGDDFWPVADLARMDERGVPRVVEISLFGATDPATARWPAERQLHEGAFRLTSRKNPHYEPALFRLVDAVARAEPSVFRLRGGARSACSWEQNLAPRTGGLHGQVAFPSARYVCGSGLEEFVGVTLIDDEQFEPRRCVWIHAPRAGAQWLTLEDVALGHRIEGYAGSSYFLMRDETHAPVSLEVFVDGRSAGRIEYRDPRGWARFAFTKPASAGQRGRLEFKLSVPEGAKGRSLCVAAETR
ncbi:MAG TPA: hypothetical protein VI197_30405 [Polyangiaceae bacterium]